MIEKEVRFLVDTSKKEEILKECTDVKEPSRVVDITFGKEGFYSLEKYGYIIRLRDKNGKKTFECKKRVSSDVWEEYPTEVDSFTNLIKSLDIMGFKPYLLLDKTRTSAKYEDLIIEFDEVDMLGNYVEIEYQESNIESVNKFIDKFGIKNEPQGLYGDIFKERIENDNGFKEDFEVVIKKYFNK